MQKATAERRNFQFLMTGKFLMNICYNIVIQNDRESQKIMRIPSPKFAYVMMPLRKGVEGALMSSGRQQFWKV
jgi:hypothetical protein